ncbi:MAG: hypothetical protein J5911_04840 [Clostridia bacterium]|nr:hypothetical protein [Clostridia bacterium]
MNGFSKVSYKTRVYKREFSDAVRTADKFTFTRTTIANASATPVKFYHCNGEIYGYSTDKKIRKVNGNEYTYQDFTSNVLPLILPVIVNGEKKVIFISDETAKIGNQTITGVPYGNSGVFCAGRLFIADGNRIRYSEEFDFVNFNVGLEFGNFIEVDLDAGEILYLAKNGDDISVVAEHALFNLSPYGKPFEFKVDRIPSFRLSVVKNSVYGEGGWIGFMSGNDFCVFSGGKVKNVSKVMHTVGNYTIGVAGGYHELYVLPYTANRLSYVFAYDFSFKKEVLEKLTTDALNTYTVAGEYASRITDIRFYRTSIETVKETASASYDGEYDFGSCAKKSVCKVEAHIDGSAEIVISGDGEYRAAITEKCNAVSCFVHGRLFNITFENASSDFKLYKLVINYVIHGE